MILLHHGSNVEIEDINLLMSKKGKDFGCGFYLNECKGQAEDMARRTTARMSQGTPTVTTFTFDEKVLEDDGLKVKIFEGYSKEWAEFVLMNRRNASEIPAHPYDIVIGPIANDTVGVQIRRFMMNYISIEKLIEELKYRGTPAVQYFFGTEKAIRHLKKKSHEQ